MSNRKSALDILRVVGMFFVMLIHAPLPACSGLPGGVAWVLKDFLASGAVPMFFLLSGYLSADRLDPQKTPAQVFFRKLETLIIPFLFWNAFLLALLLAIKQFPEANFLTVGGAHASWLSVQTDSAWSILSALLGIGRSPIVYQFWFLRDLIVANVAAFFLIRSFPLFSLAGWLLLLAPLPLVASFGFFLVGFFLRRFLRWQIRSAVLWSWLFMLAWLALGVASWGIGMEMPNAIVQLGSSLWLLSVALVLSDFRIGNKLSQLGSSVFFVYATHEPLQTILTKLWRQADLPLYETLFRLLFVPSLTFILCLPGCLMVRHVSPRLLAVVTGGR